MNKKSPLILNRSDIKLANQSTATNEKITMPKIKGNYNY